MAFHQVQVFFFFLLYCITTIVGWFGQLTIWRGFGLSANAIDSSQIADFCIVVAIRVHGILPPQSTP